MIWFVNGNGLVTVMHVRSKENGLWSDLPFECWRSERRR